MGGMKDQLREVYETVLGRMYQYGEGGKWPVTNEMLTRYTLIDPVLRTLGWPLDDPSHVFAGEGIVHRSGIKVHPDYALYKNGETVAFVEAKNWGTMYKLNHKATTNEIKRTREYRQLAKYCRECETGANVSPLGVLTDGGSWWLCDFTKSKFHDILIDRVDFADENADAHFIRFMMKLRPERISALLG